MATQIQLRRGTTAQHSGFTGAIAEVTVDTDKNVVVVHNGSTAGGFPLLKEASIGSTVQAYDANTAKTNAAQTFTAAQRGSVVTLTDGATVTPDFSLGNNFVITISGNRTLANPTNVASGQTGTIIIKQDSSGNRTMSYGSAFKFPGGTAPTLSTTSGQTDVLAYFCESSSRINAALIKNLS